MDPDGDFRLSDFNAAYASGKYDICNIIINELKANVLQARNANPLAGVIPLSVQQKENLQATDLSTRFANKDYDGCEYILSKLEISVAQKRADQQQQAFQAAADIQQQQFTEFNSLDLYEEDAPNSPQHPVLEEELDLDFNYFDGLDEEAHLQIPLDNLDDVDFLNLDNEIHLDEEDIPDLEDDDEMMVEDGIIVGEQLQQEANAMHEDDDDDDEIYQVEDDDDEETEEEEEDEDELLDEENELDHQQPDCFRA